MNWPTCDRTKEKRERGKREKRQGEKGEREMRCWLATVCAVVYPSRLVCRGCKQVNILMHQREEREGRGEGEEREERGERDERREKREAREIGYKEKDERER